MNRRFIYEHWQRPLLGRTAFLRRVAHHFGVATLVLFLALGIGVLGYHFFGRLNWIDALLNASMILGGMGPVDPLPTTAGKVFASVYALFSGLVFIGCASLVIAPFAHRLLHHFHLGED